eukprot:1145219-Pelagomonas_calceolata.AAC.8
MAHPDTYLNKVRSAQAREQTQAREQSLASLCVCFGPECVLRKAQAFNSTGQRVAGGSNPLHFTSPTRQALGCILFWLLAEGPLVTVLWWCFLCFPLSRFTVVGFSAGPADSLGKERIMLGAGSGLPWNLFCYAGRGPHFAMQTTFLLVPPLAVAQALVVQASALACLGEHSLLLCRLVASCGLHFATQTTTFYFAATARCAGFGGLQLRPHKTPPMPHLTIVEVAEFQTFPLLPGSLSSLAYFSRAPSLAIMGKPFPVHLPFLSCRLWTLSCSRGGLKLWPDGAPELCDRDAAVHVFGVQVGREERDLQPCP